MIADSAITTAGALAGIIATLGGIFLTYWATKLKGKADRSQRELDGYQFGQSVLKDGLSWTEKHNKDLRDALDERDNRIEELEVRDRERERDFAALRDRLEESEADCKRKITALALQVQRLKGLHDER